MLFKQRLNGNSNLGRNRWVAINMLSDMVLILKIGINILLSSRFSFRFYIFASRHCEPQTTLMCYLEFYLLLKSNVTDLSKLPPPTN